MARTDGSITYLRPMAEEHILLPATLSASRGDTIPWVAGAEFAEAIVALDLDARLVLNR